MCNHVQPSLAELARRVEMANKALAENRLCVAERVYRKIIAQAPTIPGPTTISARC